MFTDTTTTATGTIIRTCRRGCSQSLLAIMPPWYGNRVNTAYNRFDPGFLFALAGVSEAAKNADEQQMNGMAQPAAPAAMMATADGASRMEKKMSRSKARAADKEMEEMADEKPGKGKDEGEEPPPRERKEFRDLGYWNPSLVVGEDGRGRLSFVMPDDLTKWRLVLIGSDGRTHLMEFRDSLVTKQEIMAKLEAPRGFVAGDTAQVATVVHNYGAKPVEAKVSLDIKSGAACVLLRADGRRTLTVEPNGTGRVDWPLVARSAGSVAFTTAVVTPAGSDAETRTYPVRPRGIPKAKSETGVLTENNPQATAALPSPAQAAPGSRTLTIEYAPTLAYSMFESLEYLTGYPYGCVEQTMSRFLPNLYVAGVLKRLGIKNDSLTKMIPEYTHKGLERLRKFQHGDGGWGWWESDATDPRMTALVLYGLSHAAASDIGAKDKALIRTMTDRGISSAMSQMKARKEQEAILLAHALCAAGKCAETEKTVMAQYGKRGNLSSYELALLLECLNSLGKKAEIAKMVELLETKATEHSGSVFWSSASSYSWYRQDEETTARVLRALIGAVPNHPMIAKAVGWLSRVKRDGFWVCTKTTSTVIDALSFYLAQSGEFDPNFTATVELGGKALVLMKVNKESLKNWSGRIVVPDSLIGERSDVRFKLAGKGRLYYSVHLRYATGEHPIMAADSGIAVSRKYTRLVYWQGQDGQWEVKREPFTGSLKGGDELEVSVTVKNSRPCEFILLEDYFPSGMEVLHKEQEWYSRWCGFWWYGYNHSEARDDRMVWFVNYFGNGERTFSYLLRAETPGAFTALPARAELMYEPAVCGNSAETQVRIKDAQ
jgi:alpha-2-macroglobulin